MTDAQKRAALINKIMDDAKAKLEKLGVKHFHAVVDHESLDAEGGKVYVNADIIGEDFVHVLNFAMPRTEDVINLGVYVGQLLQHRSGAKVARLVDKNKKPNGNKKNQ